MFTVYNSINPSLLVYYIRGVSGGWAGWAIAHPCFGKRLSQISTYWYPKYEMGTYDIRNSRFKVLKDEMIVGIILIIKLLGKFEQE